MKITFKRLTETLGKVTPSTFAEIQLLRDFQSSKDKEAVWEINGLCVVVVEGVPLITSARMYQKPSVYCLALTRQRNCREGAGICRQAWLNFKTFRVWRICEVEEQERVTEVRSGASKGRCRRRAVARVSRRVVAGVCSSGSHSRSQSLPPCSNTLGMCQNLLPIKCHTY